MYKIKGQLILIYDHVLAFRGERERGENEWSAKEGWDRKEYACVIVYIRS